MSSADYAAYGIGNKSKWPMGAKLVSEPKKLLGAMLQNTRHNLPSLVRALQISLVR